MVRAETGSHRPQPAPPAPWRGGAGITKIRWGMPKGDGVLQGQRKSHGWLAAALIAGVLGGCSSGLDLGFSKKAEPAQADANAFPAQYRAEIAAFMRTYLDNPTKVRDALISVPALKPFSGAPRYVACLRYNPRDNANRYTGNQENIAVFLGGRLNQFLPADLALCANVAYQRFPEIENMVP